MNKNLFVIGIVLVVVLAGWYFLQGQKSYNPSSVPVAETVSSPSAEIKENIIIINDNSFSPAEITIKAGDSVVWKNEGENNHTVNSGPHPAHNNYPPLNLGVLKQGESKSLTFPQKGFFGYHDHLNSSLTGIVIVE